MDVTVVPVERRTNRLSASAAVAVAAIAVLNLLDLVTTHAVLSHPGAIEGNPLSALLLTNGVVGVLKAVILVALVFRIYRGRRMSIGFHATLWFVAGFYALTVLSNVLLLQRLT
jgi:uncharacterized membrane protein